MIFPCIHHVLTFKCTVSLILPKLPLCSLDILTEDLVISSPSRKTTRYKNTMPNNDLSCVFQVEALYGKPHLALADGQFENPEDEVQTSANAVTWKEPELWKHKDSSLKRGFAIY